MSDLINWSKANKELDNQDAEFKDILEKLVPLTTRFQEITGWKITIDKGHPQKAS